ncbi:E3 ubiquitin-protein ligase RNF13-like [Salvia hispanica]|uniref:E3 ubiquitin-protein ligase RNF13-like n=1 Tax=Salvia hispanica TaxID=49212 RepID=UPI00200918E5|nr:E3 ubiquitin-protein ligase RNF13-like [Salvia hispanica]
MRAITKLVSYPNKFISIFLFKIMPELIHLGILSLCIFVKYYQIFTARRRYAAAVKSSRRQLLHPPPDSDECSVCLSEFAAEECCQLAACGHTFHRRCVERWLKGYVSTCPLCRAEVVPEAVAAEHRRLLAKEEDDFVEKEFALVLLNALNVGRCNNGYFLS